MAVLKRHVVGLSAQNGLSVGQFLNGGIEVQCRLLGRCNAREQEHGNPCREHNNRCRQMAPGTERADIGALAVPMGSCTSELHQANAIKSGEDAMHSWRGPRRFLSSLDNGLTHRGSMTHPNGPNLLK